jgi:hypothetical protein
MVRSKQFEVDETGCKTKKYWRWNHPNWSILSVVEADKRFVKSPKIGP